MTALLSLTRRNVRLYLSDLVAVFLSLLGAVIAILLVLVFLKSTIVDGITTGSAGLISSGVAGHLIDAWIIPSAAVIASATTGLGALNQFVQDRQSAAWRDFLVAPVPRVTITLGYLLAAVIVSWIMTTLVYGVGAAWCAASGVPLSSHGVLLGWAGLLLSSLGFTALMACLVGFLATTAAYSGTASVIGVLFGFLSMTYVTPSGLPAGLAHALSYLPFAQASSLVRRPFAEAAVADLPPAARASMVEQLGITVSTGSGAVPPGVIVVVLAGLAIVGAAFAWQVMVHTVRR